MSVIRPTETNVFDVDDIDLLPPLPDIGLRIIQTFADEFITGNEVADVVSGDPAIAARLIGVANSAYFALREPVSGMREVINRVLGVDTVRTMALALAMDRSFDTTACPQFNPNTFWYAAIRRSEQSEQLARLAMLPLDQRTLCHTAGLCGQLGLLALAVLRPRDLGNALAVLPAQPNSILVHIDEPIDASIVGLAATIASHWNLPKAIVAAFSALEQGAYDENPVSAVLASVDVLSGLEPDAPLPELAWVQSLSVSSVDLDKFRRTCCNPDARSSADALIVD
ncbi:MAG: HDOD domain-containing protein [Pseudomonadota bacterium]